MWNYRCLNGPALKLGKRNPDVVEIHLALR